MARKTRKETERTKERILEAAEDLFIERGYERTTFEDIAQRVELSKGAVFWHFKSKTELLVQLVSTVIARHQVETGELGKVVETPRELTDMFAKRAHLAVHLKARRKFFIMMNRLNWSSPKMDVVKKRLEQLEGGVFRVISRSLERFKDRSLIRMDTDIFETTAILGSIWLGLIRFKLENHTDLDVEHAVRSGFGSMLQGIAAEGAGKE